MTTHASATTREDWENWRTLRAEAVAGPYGPLSITGTHWLEDYAGSAEGRLPAIPGRWIAAQDGSAVLLTATVGDGLTVDGAPFSGEVRLRADTGAPAGTRVAHGARRLAVLAREGLWAVRVTDPDAPARKAFRGIEVSAYDDRWTVPGRFHRYTDDRTVRVANADGRERGLGLHGLLSFTLHGTEHSLQVTEEADGSLWAVFADETSGSGSFRFRFLRPAAPDAEGRTTVDFNRALLPPCAFSDHSLCPFPPPGNTLGAFVTAGERRLLGAPAGR